MACHKGILGEWLISLWHHWSEGMGMTLAREVLDDKLRTGSILWAEWGLPDVQCHGYSVT